MSDTAIVCQNAFLCNVVQHTKTMEVTKIQSMALTVEYALQYSKVE